MSMAAPLLRVSNIETYYGPVMAIRGVSFAVDEGTICTILGANGAGKTTILKTISGAMDPRVGTVEFAGTKIEGLDTWSIAARGVSHVPEGREVFPRLSVHDNLMMGAYLRRDREATARDLDIVFGYFPRLKERSGQNAGDLSGGEQQMVAIGRALMARPRLMLLDEPSLGLAPLLVREIFGIIRRLNEEQGVTILLIEQNANMALELAHFGYVLENGRIVLEGTSTTLRDNPDVKEFYLGHRDAGVRGQRRWKRKKRWR
jgi:branched-chain amino acid transport system ATP-binding protein